MLKNCVLRRELKFFVMNVKTAVFSGENLIFYLDYDQMPNTCVLKRELNL